MLILKCGRGTVKRLLADVIDKESKKRTGDGGASGRLAAVPGRGRGFPRPPARPRAPFFPPSDLSCPDEQNAHVTLERRAVASAPAVRTDWESSSSRRTGQPGRSRPRRPRLPLTPASTHRHHLSRRRSTCWTQPLPPGPLPEAGRGRKTSSAPLSVSGRGSGGGVGTTHSTLWTALRL